MIKYSIVAGLFLITNLLQAKSNNHAVLISGELATTGAKSNWSEKFQKHIRL